MVHMLKTGKVEGICVPVACIGDPATKISVVAGKVISDNIHGKCYWQV